MFSLHLVLIPLFTNIYLFIYKQHHMVEALLSKTLSYRLTMPEHQAGGMEPIWEYVRLHLLERQVLT